MRSLRPRSLLPLVVLATGAAAQDGEQGEPGDEPPVETMLVTPTLSRKADFDLPYAAAAVTAETLDERAIRTVPQALRDVPGVMVQETAHGHGSPYLRGFTSFRNVFLIDGIRLNNSVFRPGPNQYWNTVDPFTIEQLEVVLGPSSVLYGSDAIGGTVNAITRDPWRRTAAGSVHGELTYRWADAENYSIGRAQVGASFGPDTAALVGVTTKDYGDLHGGSEVGLQRETGYDELDADVKVVHFLGDSTSLTFAHQHVEQHDVPRTHRTVYGIDWEDLDVGTDLRREFDQKRQLSYVQLESEGLDGWFDSARTSLSWHEQEEDRDRIKSGGAREQQGFDVGTLGFFTHLGKDTSSGRWTYGVEYYRDDVDSYLDRFGAQTPADDIQGPVADDATYDLFGVFVQDELAASERLDLILGARWNRAAADADSVRDPVTGQRISIDDDWSALVGSARFVYALTPERWNLFGGISQGFRAPNLSDLSRFDSALSNEFEVPSPDLDPEHTISYELGVKHRSETVSGRASLFYTDVEDQIVRFPTGNTNADGDVEVTKDNVGDGYVYGVEVAGSWRWTDDWSVFGHGTFLEGKQDNFPTPGVSEEEYRTRLMPLTLQAGLRWDAPDERTWSELVTTWADDADKLSSSDERDTTRIPPGGTPDYTVVDLRVGHRFNDSVSLTLALENVFDEDYRIHGSGVNRPGRNFLFGLTVRF